MICCIILAMLGSSPLTRGKVPASPGLCSVRFIIPAYAGKSYTSELPTGQYEDHPRLRGEKQLNSHHETTHSGSSPLTRGKGQLKDLAPLVHRIIPAYAGKSQKIPLIKKRLEDHPRLRGEKKPVVQGPNSSKGSSPLTRGKVNGTYSFCCSDGIIPAYAGKSYAFELKLGHNTDHPRLRGEKVLVNPKRPPRRGSSPLTRGKAMAKVNQRVQQRIIPAYAGKRPPKGPLSLPKGDHPRLRGEKALSRNLARCPLGSSPLTRGKGLNKVNRFWAKRIIPAYAGKSMPILSGLSRLQDHPRLRGEKRGSNCFDLYRAGSSPLTRGKELARLKQPRRLGIIPAYAGKRHGRT